MKPVKEQQLKQETTILLSPNDAAMLLERIKNPPKPNEALLEAFKRHKLLVEGGHTK